MPIEMKIPTYEEWDELMDVCQESNAVSNWRGMYFWVTDDRRSEEQFNYQAYRGCDTACSWYYYRASLQHPLIGFRPAFDNLHTDISEDGAVRVIGTLYMDGIPVPAPSKPTYDGDILDYIPDAKLEMREPLDDPQYQVRAIKVGSTYIADRVLLKNISYEDIVTAITTKRGFIK